MSSWERTPLISSDKDEGYWTASTDGEVNLPEPQDFFPDVVERVVSVGSGQKRLGVLAVLMLAFFLTCGGPFGIEEAVAAAGPLVTLGGLLLVAALWSLPQALLSAELSLLYEENGGSAVWVERALPAVCHWVNGTNLFLNSASSYSVLLVLMIDYLPLELPVWGEWIAKLCVVSLVALINIMGSHWVSRVSLPLLVLIMVPFFFQVGFEGAAGHIVEAWRWREFSRVPADIDWSVLISTLVWSIDGFDGLGSVAAEVHGGRRTYIMGIVLSFPLVFFNYLLPVLIGFIITSDFSLWEKGGFVRIAFLEADWLGWVMVAAAILSNVGQYTTGVASAARQLWALSIKGRGQLLPTFLGYSYVSLKDDAMRPVAAIIVTSLICLGFSALPFGVVVQVFLFIRAINLIMIYVAFVRLRYPPHTTAGRTFLAPGGKVVVWLYGVPTVVLSGVCLYFTRDWLVWTINLVIQAVLMLLYLVRWGVMRCRNRRRHVTA